MSKKQAKVVVGLPVYNGEEFIRRAIDSVLAQTFSNIELIISDNGSIDSTPQICNDYEKKDERIRYIRHDVNRGGIWNFQFVLDQAKSEYFVWLGADDYLDTTFLEKNINVLDSNKNIAFSTSKIKPFGPNYDRFKINVNDTLMKKIYKKIRLHYRPYHCYSTSGTYENRISSALRHSIYYLFIHACFRTDVLRIGTNLSGHSEKDMFARQFMLIALRYGNAHVIDEFLIYRYTAGVSGQEKNPISEYSEGRIESKDLFFSKITYMKWCWKNLGKKIFLQNLDFFIKLGLADSVFTFISLFRYGIRHKN